MGDGKKALIGIALAAIVIAFVVNLIAKNNSDSAQFLYYEDETGTLSQSTKEIIQDANVELEENYGGAQFFVAVVETIGSKNIVQYSKAYFDDKGIGSSKNNNGLLLLVALNEDNYYAMYGSGLDDSFAGEIAVVLEKYMEPEFAAGNIDTAVATTVPRLVSILKTECALWYSGIEAPTEIPTQVITLAPTQTVTLAPTSYAYDDDINVHVGNYNVISLLGMGIGFIIRTVFRLIFGLISSVGLGFVIVVIIIISICNSGNKRSRRSGGVYFRNIPPSEPFENSPRTTVYHSSSRTSGGPTVHRSSSGSYRRPGNSGGSYGRSSYRSGGSSGSRPGGSSFGGGRSSGSGAGRSSSVSRGPSGRSGGGSTSGGGAGRR